MVFGALVLQPAVNRVTNIVLGILFAGDDRRRRDRRVEVLHPCQRRRGCTPGGRRLLRVELAEAHASGSTSTRCPSAQTMKNGPGRQLWSSSRCHGISTRSTGTPQSWHGGEARANRSARSGAWQTSGVAEILGSQAVLSAHLGPTPRSMPSNDHGTTASGGRSGCDAVLQVDDAVAEPALVEQLERRRGRRPGSAALPPPTTIGDRNRWISSTSPAASACAASSGPPTQMSRSGRVLELADRVRVELALDPRPGAGRLLQRPGVDDLVRRPPDLREVAHAPARSGRPSSPTRPSRRTCGGRELGADRPLEVVDERVHLLVRHRTSPTCRLRRRRSRRVRRSGSR